MLDEKVLTIEDFVITLKYPLKLQADIGVIDDIDHLSNRRVRSVGAPRESVPGRSDPDPESDPRRDVALRRHRPDGAS
ncbi:MAG: hypothetical protein MZV49_04675 [Rhodopseudomonas palustris]|nr:hypothetical protein [Rhodopseudomonas palustris]